MQLCDGNRFRIILVFFCLGKHIQSQIGCGHGNFLCVYHVMYASGVLHTRHMLDVFYLCASTQLKNLSVLNNSEPGISSFNF